MDNSSIADDSRRYQELLRRSQAARGHIANLRESIRESIRNPALFDDEFYRLMVTDLRDTERELREFLAEMNLIRNRSTNYLIQNPDPDDKLMIAVPEGMALPPLPNNPSGSGLYSKYKRRRQI